MIFNLSIPESLDRSALRHDEYGRRPVNGELKSHKRVQESFSPDELLDDFNQEQGEGDTSETGAHDVKRLLEVVVFERLDTSRRFKGL